MNTAEIPAFLVEPAAGMVYRTGGVFFCHHFRNTGSIELSPAFVEGHPYGDGRDIVQVIYGVKTFLFPAFPAFFRTTGEQLIMIILRVGGHVGEQCGHIAYPGHMIGRAAADHILPYDHSQTIAVIIPAQRLELDMFPEHIEAQPFCEADIIDKGLIAGSSHQPVGPVALIQDSMEKIRSVIQAEARDALRIWLYGVAAHGKIAVHGITIGIQSKGIQPGVFRTPGLEIYRLRCISGIRCRIGDAGGKRKHNRGMREPKGILLLRNFTFTHPRE
jgi:hypothetical protein